MAKIVQIKGETIDADAFAKAYCENMNAEASASASGCSGQRAKEIGQMALRRKDVRAAIEKGLEEKAITNEISVNWIIKRLVEIIEFDPSEVLLVDRDGCITIDPDAKNGLKHFESFGSSFSSGEFGNSTSIALKRSDRLKAIDLLIGLMGYEQVSKANGDGGQGAVRAIHSRVLGALRKRGQRGLPDPSQKT